MLIRRSPGRSDQERSEVNATGQDLCSFLTKYSIATLYKPIQNHPEKFRISSTPSPRFQGQIISVSRLSPLCWNDSVWVEKFVRMISIFRIFLVPSCKSEIHPGIAGILLRILSEGVKAIQS